MMPYGSPHPANASMQYFTCRSRSPQIQPTTKLPAAREEVAFRHLMQQDVEAAADKLL